MQKHNMQNFTDNSFVKKQALNRLTTFRMGGVPLFYSQPHNYEELGHALRLCRDNNLDFKVLGGGSNLVVDDYELDFGVIHICNPVFNKITAGPNNTVHVGAGVSLRSILRFCKDQGRGGAEFLAGIPGTLGGAVAGNAGAWGSSVESVLKSVITVDRCGETRRLLKKDIDFSYRKADLGGQVITEAEMELQPRSPELVKKLIKKNLDRKKASQPTSKPNAGCIFKNPANESAGKLLDVCGFKGWSLGGARVSDQHANFICNDKKASSQDVFRMIEKMKKAVKEKFDIDLELEVKLWRKDDNAKVA